MALAEVPEHFREEAIQLYFNSNDGAFVCTPPMELDEADLSRFPFWKERSSPSRPHDKRDWLLSELNDLKELDKNYAKCKWTAQGAEGFWVFQQALKNAIRELEGIEDNGYKPRAAYFMSCSYRRSAGYEVVYKDGKRCLTTISCSETSCPDCYDRGKRRRVNNKHSWIMEAAKKTGVHRLWVPVFTLPDEIASKIPRKTPERKAVMDGLKVLLRKIFGVNTRDLLACYANIHAVGGKDLFKTRFHIHCGILPIAVSNRTKKLIKCDVPDMLDEGVIKSEWRQVLQKVFPDIEVKEPVVHLEYISLNQKFSSDKLGHRLKYDMRGFGKDILEAPIFFDETYGLAVVEAEEGNYRLVTTLHLAQRWQWIRSQRDFRTWGLLDQTARYSDLIGIEFVVEPEPEVEEVLDIHIHRELRFHYKKGKGLIRTVERYAVRRDGQRVPSDVEWGRRGSEGWRPKMEGQRAVVPG